MNLKRVWEHVKTMVEDHLQVFEHTDFIFFKNFDERDKEVDKMRWSIFRECIIYMIGDPRVITPCAFFAMITRYLERTGDNACKITEKVHYMDTGDQIEII
ncbi:MAG: phosphate uptake regulator PhoU [Candidatus Thorarchaeota archaeon]